MNRTIRIAHLVVGLLFLGIAAIWLLRATGVIDTHALAVSGPVLLITAGVVGLVVSLAGSRRGGRPVETRYDDPSLTYPQSDNIDYIESKENDHE